MKIDLTGPESVGANSRRSLGAVLAAALLVQTCGRYTLSAEARQALSWKRLVPGSSALETNSGRGESLGGRLQHPPQRESGGVCPSCFLDALRRQRITRRVLDQNQPNAGPGQQHGCEGWACVSQRKVRGNPNPSGCEPVWKEGLCRYSSFN